MPDLEIYVVAVDIKAAKNGDFYDELLSENGFEAVSETFSCYDYGADTSEGVHEIKNIITNARRVS